MLAVAVAVASGPLIVLLLLGPVSELLSLLKARRRRSSSGRTEPVDPPHLLVLVPAHDEEEMIHPCVTSLLRMRYPADRLDVYVIADNCTDHTAGIARGGGANCLERQDRERRGKPHAIAWALDHLRHLPWETCVIVDADSEVESGFAAGLLEHAPLREKCVQAYFDVLNPEESWLTRLGALLAKVRYEGSYPLKEAARLNCPLTGNGMCIGRDLLAAGWPAFSLTENWELYAKFTAEGVGIRYASSARLFSQEASSLGQAQTQRRRWLAGRMMVLKKYFYPLLRSREIGLHQKLDAIAELASLSPILHGTAVGLLSAALLFALPLHFALPLTILAIISLAPLLLHGAAAVRSHPRRWRIAASLLLLPLYVAWRITTAFLTVGTFRQGQWKKTERG